jgi:hypothetical protein
MALNVRAHHGGGRLETCSPGLLIMELAPANYGSLFGVLLRKGIDRATDTSANEDTWSYTVGSYVPDAVAIVAGGGAVRSLGFHGKLGLHDAHHTFGRFGTRSHLQVNIWQKGVKGWKYVRRQRLPFKKWPKKSHWIEF